MQYLVSIPNSGIEGVPKILRSDDMNLVARWIKAEDRPGQSIYYCPNPLKPEARTHGKDGIQAIRVIYIDIDFKDVTETVDEIDLDLQNLLLTPTEVVDSGHGRHVKYELKEEITYNDADFGRVCALQAKLIEYFAGDPSVRPWSLLRRPGTTNSKEEPHVPCRVLRQAVPVDLTELQDMCELVDGTTLLTRKPAPEGNGHDRTEGAPRTSEGKLPIDVDGRLAAMRFKGSGDTAINITRRDVMGSLLRHHVSLSEATATILEATRHCVTDVAEAAGWDWQKEELTIAWSGAALINKDPTLVDRLPDGLRLKYEELAAAGRQPSIRKNRYSLFVSSARGVAGMPSKTGTIRDLLLKGTTHRELLEATGWPSVSIPHQARQAGMLLTKYVEDGVTKYKGTLADDGQAPNPGRLKLVHSADSNGTIAVARMPRPRGEAAGDSPPSKRRFKLVAFNDLRPGPEPLYLVDELIPVAGLVDVWGKAKCYKSFWCLDLMLHVAMGWEYRDRYVSQGAVVYCAFEGAHGYKKRIEAQRRHYTIADDTAVPLYVMPGQANLIVEHAVLISDIREQLGEVRPAAVVLDTLNKSLFGSENKDVDMGAYVRAAEAIRDAFHCVVIIVHHCGYDDTRPRGHSSLPGAVDAQLAVTRAEEIITVTVEMMRDGPEDTQVVSEAEVIEVGEDQNGKTLTSLVIVPSDAEAATRDQRGWPRGLRVFHDALKAALAANGEMFQPEAGVLPIKAVNQWHVRERFYANYAEAEENSEKRQSKLRVAFNRALAEAQHRGTAKFVRTADGQEMLWLPARQA
jgi:hypothetical protein